MRHPWEHLRELNSPPGEVDDGEVDRGDTIPNRTATGAIGSCSGMSTYQSFFTPVAPSILAASSTSFGIDARPAMKITTAKEDPPRVRA
jgi:hypothetical protein